jgi:hypothetical protein
MLDGTDYRSWQRSRTPQLKPVPAQVNLSLTLTQSPGHIDAQVGSRVAASIDRQKARLFLALYENRLSSRVAAGENARRTLNHDYVVRELVGPLDLHARHRFKLQAGWKTADLGVAAFMLNARGDTLQALALAACP